MMYPDRQPITLSDDELVALEFVRHAARGRQSLVSTLEPGTADKYPPFICIPADCAETLSALLSRAGYGGTDTDK